MKTNTGKFHGIRVPSEYAKFVNVLSKIMRKSEENALLYLIQIGIECIVDESDISTVRLEKMHKEIVSFQKLKKPKTTTGLSIDDGVRIKMHDIMKSHPCRVFMSYEN